MNPNGNYYYWHGHQIQNYSLPMESDLEGQATLLDPTVFFEAIPIQYDFDFNEMGHSGHSGHQWNVATSSSHHYTPSDYFEMQNNSEWMQQTYVNGQNAEIVPSLDANAMEIQQMKEGMAARNVGKSARKRKNEGMGEGNAVGGEKKKRKQKRSEDQIKAQKETKIKNKITIEKEELDKKAEQILDAINGKDEGVAKMNAGFIEACNYKNGRQINAHKYFRDRLVRILLNTHPDYRDKLVQLFIEGYSGHIWALAKENKNAVRPGNKQFTTNIFVYKKSFSLAELVIIMKTGLFMENGESARFKADSKCKEEKEGRQCLNPYHWYLHYSKLDHMLYKERRKLKKNGGEFDKEKGNLLNAFGMKIYGADEYEENEGSDYSAEE